MSSPNDVFYRKYFLLNTAETLFQEYGYEVDANHSRISDEFILRDEASSFNSHQHQILS